VRIKTETDKRIFAIGVIIMLGYYSSSKLVVVSHCLISFWLGLIVTNNNNSYHGRIDRFENMLCHVMSYDALCSP
jgi:hypothetical protein